MSAFIVMQDGKPASNASLVGGETEELRRLTKFAAECRAQPNKETKIGNNRSIYGANFSCKMTISAASSQKDDGSDQSDTGLNWLMYELLWRDFFRFITKKYSDARQQIAVPVTACAGAAAAEQKDVLEVKIKTYSSLSLFIC
ncbi:photolyase/blue-light receptor 2 [Actinidia rufa]|uniref:Photolyase/blue-light receptor 2 n=1 Tax=Actinidia rufa TaxID=165716 RepID=A0A7J0H8H6_9ERIC|nr:photolyase/blue-light receptor 2 [Actinidia rufa]